MSTITRPDTQMFGYYGSKWRIVRHYPAPRYDRIVEPFCGSAAYSLWHADGHDVWINDLDDGVIAAWQWLQRASPADVLMLPRIGPGTNILALNLPPGPRALLGLWGNMGKFGARSRKVTDRSTIKYRRRDAAKLLPCIRDWTITNGNYRALPDIEATWFIDPPYNDRAGREYRGGRHIDYAHLSEWCRSRRGQVIVCERASATWLPFRPLVSVRGWGARSKDAMFFEGLWTNDSGSSDR